MSEIPSILSHVSIGTNQFAKAVAFYDAVMPTLGSHKVENYPDVVAYGKVFPEFFVHTPHDGQPASVGNGYHIGFMASSKAMVDAFYQAAIAAGATDDGPPGPRPAYGDPYYGCFVRDLDGHKIEATFWDESLETASANAADSSA